MGLYPTVVDWTNDGKHDLLVGDVNGNVIIYKNTNDNTNPVLDSGALVLSNIDDRATPIVDDWNGDGKKDLLVGSLTGTIQIYVNQGTDASPSFSSYTNLLLGGSTFDMGSRSAPRIYDWNGDGIKDILVGDYSGSIYYLQNFGSNSSPIFNTAEQLLLGDGTLLRYLTDPINPSSGPRSRFDVVDWDNDGLADLVVGGQDGRIMLFAAAPEPVSSVLFVIGGGVFALSGLRKKIRKRNS